ncbi:MAG: PorP/SprF family type IX secretion system membrane protein [Saprospiraceae bacterium]|nr:PorP/SprF family type IX secretion system membrane protein [Saprospiraceae bacterium]
MRCKLYLILLFLLVVGVHLTGQDLHFSYYQFTPLNVNPANAGAFSGSYRISGIYSDKQAAIATRGFKTLTLSADAPIIRGIRKQDWVGLGVEADLIGSSGGVFDHNNTSESVVAPGGFQSWTFIKVGAAYHLSLDKKQTNILTLGAQFSSGSRNYFQLTQKDARVNPQTGYIDQEIIQHNANGSGQGGGQNQDPNDKISTGHKDWTMGLLYNSKRKNADLKLGIAMEGLFRPVVSFNQQQDSTENKYRGLNIHGAYDMAINKRVNIIPGFYYYTLGPANAFNVNTHATYLLDPEKDLKLSTGLGVRNLRALIFYAGAEFSDIKVGFAFDMDISTATIGSNSVGGFELCASYMGKIYKKPKVKPVIFCPRL